MKIELAKFGHTLSSRPSGKEAYMAFLPTLNTVKDDEPVEVDCGGIGALSPSWGDEFLVPLHAKFTDRLSLTNTGNASVVMTIEVLEETNGIKFKVV